MKNPAQLNKSKVGVIAMTFTAAAISLGCTSSPFSLNDSSGASGEQSTGQGVGRMTGGAEARPTADPGVTPGKKPGE